jgi:glutamate racemase
MKIGFFDSGLGGLIILKAVAKELPSYDYEFYGDTAHVPYGDRTEEEIEEFTKVGIEYLFLHGCALVIVACNTSSAETLRRLQDSLLTGTYADRRILGVIVPTVEEVVSHGYARAVLIATTRTVSSGKYERELKKLDRSLILISIATPELVPCIEAGQDEAAYALALTTLEATVKAGDVVILGCTHYALLKDRLRAHFGSTVDIISQDEVIPKKLADYLDRHTEITTRLSHTGKRNIHLTAHRPDYDRLTAEFLGGVYVQE